jgi:hypothetical protein
MRPMFMVLLLLSGCAALGAEVSYSAKVHKDSKEQAPKPETIPGKHHCDTGEEVECCCIRDITGKISNCTCVEK